MRDFLSEMFSTMKKHPLAFVGFIFVVVLFLGGAVWWVLGKLFALLRKVPGGAKVEGAIKGASAATGS